MPYTVVIRAFSFNGARPPWPANAGSAIFIECATPRRVLILPCEEGEYSDGCWFAEARFATDDLAEQQHVARVGWPDLDLFLPGYAQPIAAANEPYTSTQETLP